MGNYTDPETGSEQNQQYMIRNLREKETGLEFAVFTTHLKAKKGFESMREGQVDQILDLCTKAGESEYDYPMIITGDFNDVPESEALQKMLNSDKVQSVHGKHQPEFTTHKYRHGTGLQTRTIDYMFYKQAESETAAKMI